MEKYEIINGGICAAKGFKASGLYCGIKHGRFGYGYGGQENLCD